MYVKSHLNVSKVKRMQIHSELLFQDTDVFAPFPDNKVESQRNSMISETRVGLVSANPPPRVLRQYQQK